VLYDPKWEKQAEQKADPLTLGALIAWLEQQPADDEYCYFSHGNCLLAKYLTAHGFKNVRLGGDYYRHGETPEAANKTRHKLPRAFEDIAVEMPHTFGTALERARKAVQS
jgi:hypothetical protein